MERRIKCNVLLMSTLTNTFRYCFIKTCCQITYTSNPLHGTSGGGNPGYLPSSPGWRNPSLDDKVLQITKDCNLFNGITWVLVPQLAEHGDFLPTWYL